jgi:hypothetical protein
MDSFTEAKLHVWHGRVGFSSLWQPFVRFGARRPYRELPSGTNHSLALGDVLAVRRERRPVLSGALFFKFASPG